MRTITGAQINERARKAWPDRDPPWTVEDDLVERACGHAARWGPVALTLTFDAETLESTRETVLYFRKLQANVCLDCAVKGVTRP